jgi:hypothetical protein
MHSGSEELSPEPPDPVVVVLLAESGPQLNRDALMRESIPTAVMAREKTVAFMLLSLHNRSAAT